MSETPELLDPRSTTVCRRLLVETGAVPHGAIGYTYEQGFFHPDPPEVSIICLDGGRYYHQIRDDDADRNPLETIESDIRNGERRMKRAKARVAIDVYYFDPWRLLIYQGSLKGLQILATMTHALDSELPPMPKDFSFRIEVTGKKGWSNRELAFLTQEDHRQLVASTCDEHPST